MHNVFPTQDEPFRSQFAGSIYYLGRKHFHGVGNNVVLSVISLLTCDKIW
jgi:hypothetical protein